MTRRTFAGLATAALLGAEDEWIQLFNGRDLTGWRASENAGSWSVKDGMLAAEGPRSHLFYNGPAHSADFRNFELEVEAMARPLCNSGVYFHTAYQQKNFPNKGFEIQINNTADGEGNYRERKKTASLYGLRNMYKQFVPDNEWFKLGVLVRGKNIQVRLNGMLAVDYTEPTPPIVPAGGETERFLSHGTFALQCHNDGSHAYFRSVKVRPLPDDLPTPGPPPMVDEMFRKIIDIGRHNVPMADYHVNLRPGLTLEQAVKKSLRDGIQYGIVTRMGSSAGRFDEKLRTEPVFIAMQAEGRDWAKRIPRATLKSFDYVLSPDAASATGAIDRAIGMLEDDPIDILVAAAFVERDQLWTSHRVDKVIEAAAKSQVSIEISDRYQLPSPDFIRAAKAAKCKFAFGTDNAGAADLRRSDYGIRMLEECKLTWQDMFVPGAFWPRAADRK